MSSTKNPIICALDTTDVGQAKELVHNIRKHVGAVKLGLEFFTYNGVKGVEEISKEEVPIFLDLKFHDIPNTVSSAIKALSGLNIFMTTIHTSGGRKMMQDAANVIKETFPYSNPPAVVGVTVLTSLNDRDLSDIGIAKDVESQVSRLAKLAHESGLNGVVCSPHEVEKLRKELPKSFKLVVPGIRPEGSDKGDQKRVMTPKEALSKGADYLVIGRPITQAEDPAHAARSIVESLG